MFTKDIEVRVKAKKGFIPTKEFESGWMTWDEEKPRDRQGRSRRHCQGALRSDYEGHCAAPGKRAHAAFGEMGGKGRRTARARAKGLRVY